MFENEKEKMQKNIHENNFKSKPNGRTKTITSLSASVCVCICLISFVLRMKLLIFCMVAPILTINPTKENNEKNIKHKTNKQTNEIGTCN